jgi:hypothetical protein
MKGLRLSPAVAAAVAALFVLAGCTSDAMAKSEAQRDFADMIAGALQDAEAGGAGEAQLEILRHARLEGVVSMEDDRAAANAMVQCVEDAGSEAFITDQTMQSGVVLPAYNWKSDTPEQAAIGDACDTQEAFWVNGAYQMQPASIALNDAYLDKQLPLVRTCLEREGYAADPEATTHEVLRQALQVKTDTASAVDCLAEAKIDGF